jgi:pimeloyl-ACP methyl ester carboxylesterase
MRVEIATLQGIDARTVTTARLATRVLFSGPTPGVPVLFLHGNITSATWWEEIMLGLPDGFRGIAPDQRGFGDADPGKKIDATRGMGDLMDDVIALLNHLELDRVHLVGNSMGGSVSWRLMMEHPRRIRTVTLVSPGSPYGFGGTRDAAGTPCYPDFAGSGSGLANPELVDLMMSGDRKLDSLVSPRAVLRTLVFRPPNVPGREEDLLSSTLTTHLGPRDLPGDAVMSTNWPFVAPGEWGMGNAASPKYAGDISRLYDIDPKPPVLWIRGSHDLAVSDASAWCPGTLGAAGLIPGWPGADVFPPQPMLGQTRAVLEKYAGAGGWFREQVIEDTGHVPFIERPDAFNALFHDHIGGR